MLPIGHVAGGYLSGVVLLKILKPELSAVENNNLLLFAIFFGFAPDLDVFWFFFKNKTMLVASSTNETSHRKFIGHAPLLWLVFGLIIFFSTSNLYVKYVGLIFWAGSWSHFLLDSIEYGIMWLWPFSNKIYALKDTAVSKPITEKGFINHTFAFLKFYFTRLTFYLEILIIITALAVYLQY